jgi:putative transposase
MAQREEHHPLEAAFSALPDHGLDGVGEALRIMVTEASKIERTQFLNAQPHERTHQRTDYANGFEPNRYDPSRRTPSTFLSYAVAGSIRAR